MRLFRCCTTLLPLTPFIGLALLLGSISAQEAKEPALPKRPATPEEIAKWAQDLNSDEFLARENATLGLIAAGIPAVAPTKKVLATDSLEATTRALHVLRELGLSSDLDVQEAARSALEDEARQATAVGKRAATAIAWLNEQRSSQTVRDLEALGAEIARTQYADQFGITEMVESVQLGPAWKGTEKDLRRLKWLQDVKQIILVGDKMTDASLPYVALMPGLKSIHLYRSGVTDAGIASLATAGSLQEIGIYYAPVGDAAVAPLSRLSSTLTSLKLYGTKVTPEARVKLAAALKIAKIDYRLGAFLGVGCAPVDGNCVISTVHEESPAAKAGLQTGDILLRFAGKEVADFEALTAVISQHTAGDMVDVEVRRADGIDGLKPLTLKVTLGEWDVNLSVRNGTLRP